MRDSTGATGISVLHGRAEIVIGLFRELFGCEGERFGSPPLGAALVLACLAGCVEVPTNPVIDYEIVAVKRDWPVIVESYPPFPFLVTHHHENDSIRAAVNRAVKRWADILSPTPDLQWNNERWIGCNDLTIEPGPQPAGFQLHVFAYADTARRGVSGWASGCGDNFRHPVTGGLAIGFVHLAYKTQANRVQWDTEKVAAHEIGHALGIGGAEWRRWLKTLPDGRSVYTKPRVVALYQQMSESFWNGWDGSTGIPLAYYGENGPSNTIHWDECAAPGDIMAVPHTFISELTAAALAGYSYAPSALELRTLPDSLRRSFCE